MELRTSDVFNAIRNAYQAGLMEQAPGSSYTYKPGRRYYETIKELLSKYSMEVAAKKIDMLTPLIKYLAVEENWKPVELETYHIFNAIRNISESGLIELSYNAKYEYTPGMRYYERIKEYLSKLSMEEIAKKIEISTPIIKFLSDERNWIINQE